MPLRLRRVLREDILVMTGYCEVFGVVMTCLKDDIVPSSNVVDKRIKNSLGQTNDCAKFFLMMGGQAKYALQYLLTRIQEGLMVHGGLRQAETELAHLPRCANDTRFDMIRERILHDTLDLSI